MSYVKNVPFNSRIKSTSFVQLIFIQLLFIRAKNTVNAIVGEDEVRTRECNVGVDVLLLDKRTFSFQHPLCIVDVGLVQVRSGPLIRGDK